MGGSDQWGNIVGGIELGRRTEGVELFGLTSPLLTTASGAKMGKTAAGAVWLNPDMRLPYDYWQYLAEQRGRRRTRFLSCSPSSVSMRSASSPSSRARS